MDKLSDVLDHGVDLEKPYGISGGDEARFKHPVQIPRIGVVWLDPHSVDWTVHMTSTVYLSPPGVGSAKATLAVRGKGVDVSCAFKSPDEGKTWIQFVHDAPGLMLHFGTDWDGRNWVRPTDATRRLCREVIPVPCLAWLTSPANKAIILAAQADGRIKSALNKREKAHALRAEVRELDTDATALEAEARRLRTGMYK